MTGVLGRPYLKRQDIALGVGRSQNFGVRWHQTAETDGTGLTPVDLTGYVGTVQITSLSGDGWLEFAPVLHEDGLVEIVFTSAMTGGPEWDARTAGRWAATVTAPDGIVTCLVAGYVTLTSTGGL